MLLKDSGRSPGRVYPILPGRYIRYIGYMKLTKDGILYRREGSIDYPITLYTYPDLVLLTPGETVAFKLEGGA